MQNLHYKIRFRRLHGWRPDDHPRDRDGRFAPKGSRVMIQGRGEGIVRGTAGHDKLLIEENHNVSPVARRLVTLLPEAPPAPKTNGPTPLTDAQYKEHLGKLRGLLDTAIKNGNTSDRLHTKNGDGKTYTPERAKQHKEIVDGLMDKYANTPKEGKAILSGGLGGAGKSTVLRDHANVSSREFATINVDDVKEIMAEKGMVPSVEGTSPMEGAALIHEESGHIANLLAKRLYKKKTNVIWDITMSSQDSTEKRVAELRKNGYKNIRSVFVDIPVEESVNRALARHRNGLERHRAGQGQGGRFVPPEVIRANQHADWSSANRANFETMKAKLDGWVLFDNSVNGRAPEMLDANGWHDDPRAEKVALLEAALRQVRYRPGSGVDPQLVEIETRLQERLDEAYAAMSDHGRAKLDDSAAAGF